MSEAPPPSGEQTYTTSTSSNQVFIRGAGNTDQPTSLVNDTLGFKPYVEAVFSYLKNPLTKPPFTLSIEGDWGSGKSSFMFQLEESLHAAKMRTIKFNAWRHDKVESMWAAFALHFIKELTGKLPWYHRLWVHFKLRYRRFDLSKGWFSIVKNVVLFAFFCWLIVLVRRQLPALENLSFIKEDKINLAVILPLFGSAGVFIGLLFFLQKISVVTGNPFKADLQRFITKPNYEGNAAFIEEFHRDFDVTVKLLARGEEKIFVFVDDLDRAEVPKAAELMQGLNMMISNNPRLIFIIGMDREKVAAGVAAKYKDLLPFLNPEQGPLNTVVGLEQARAFGYTFLEKFIQLSFKIPIPSKDATEDFIRSLSGAQEVLQPAATTISYQPVLTIADGEDTQQFQEVIMLLAPFFDYNPRKIKQLINVFRLKAHIANSTGLFIDDNPEFAPLNIPRLGKFIAITLKWPQLVDDLVASPFLIREILKEKTGLDSPVSGWESNKEFMRLLQLGPDTYGSNRDYSIEYLDVLPLIETSPTYIPNAAGDQDRTDERAFESYDGGDGSRRNPPPRQNISSNSNYSESSYAPPPVGSSAPSPDYTDYRKAGPTATPNAPPAP